MRKTSLLTGLYLSACLLLWGCFSAGAAYIDPSVVSYGVQAIVGIAIAAGAVFFVWWRKVKSKVSKTLGIDENAGKEVEEDIVIAPEEEATTPSENNTKD